MTGARIAAAAIEIAIGATAIEVTVTGATVTGVTVPGVTVTDAAVVAARAVTKAPRRAASAARWPGPSKRPSTTRADHQPASMRWGPVI